MTIPTVTQEKDTKIEPETMASSEPVVALTADDVIQEVAVMIAEEVVIEPVINETATYKTEESAKLTKRAQKYVDDVLGLECPLPSLARLTSGL